MSPKSKKRKLAANVERCIFYASGIQHNEFTSFNNVKGSAGEKLAYLLDIREKRLNEYHDSPYRMEDICSLIPESLANVNIKEVGYHRGCYQNFTKNLDRLRSDTSTVENTKLTRSIRKPSASNDPGKFPTECSFFVKSRQHANLMERRSNALHLQFLKPDNPRVTLETTSSPVH